MRVSHDMAFKRLLAHPELVRVLLALVPGCPIEEASCLDRVNCSFVSSSERQRYADMVWRVDCSGGPFHVLIEFQSAFDRQMDQRMKVYAGLLSQDLAAQHKRELSDLLPVVVYSGGRKWPAAHQGYSAWLRPFQRGKVFHLIDEERAGRSIIGDVIRLVRADSLATVIASARALFDWSLASDGLRQDVSRIANERAGSFGIQEEIIMGDNVRPKVPPELTTEEKQDLFEMYRSICMILKDTPEVRRMVQARTEARRQGALEGRQQGRLEGRAEVLRKLLGEACGKSNQLALAQVEAIRNADVNQLERWVGRLVAGETLERVLAEVGP